MMRVFLIGYMGVGKTTIGKRLSEKLELEFIDLDQFIENRYRKKVQEIFAEKGEDKFRIIEREMLREVATFQNVLISTGGGTPCFFNNMELMNEQGVTIYLRATVEELTTRLLASKNVRPIIHNKPAHELKDFIIKHLNEREVYYSKAHLVYQSERLISYGHVHKSVDSLYKMLQEYLLNK